MSDELARRFHSQDPADAAWRLEAARVDAAIEGIPESPSLRAFLDDLRAKGVPAEERIALLAEYVRKNLDEKGMPASPD